MSTAKVGTFFYGSFINTSVLAEVGLVPDRVTVAVLNGFDICIQPLANLIRSDARQAYGIIVDATHAELERLYGYVEHKLGGVYLPEAVLVETADKTWAPVLTYISHTMESRPPANDYVDRIVDPARALGFPQWYIDRLESFRTP